MKRNWQTFPHEGTHCQLKYLHWIIIGSHNYVLKFENADAIFRRNQCEINKIYLCALLVKMKVSISLRVGRSFWYFRRRWFDIHFRGTVFYMSLTSVRRFSQLNPRTEQITNYLAWNSLRIQPLSSLRVDRDVSAKTTS